MFTVIEEDVFVTQRQCMLLKFPWEQDNKILINKIMAAQNGTS